MNVASCWTLVTAMRGHRTERSEPSPGLEGLPLGAQRPHSDDQCQHLDVQGNPISVNMLTSLVSEAICPPTRFLALSWTSCHSMTVMQRGTMVSRARDELDDGACGIEAWAQAKLIIARPTFVMDLMDPGLQWLWQRRVPKGNSEGDAAHCTSMRVDLFLERE